jgi:hypothetical protein
MTVPLIFWSMWFYLESFDYRIKNKINNNEEIINHLQLIWYGSLQYDNWMNSVHMIILIIFSYWIF